MPPDVDTGLDGLARLLEERSLPTARAGYDCEATDGLLGRLAQGLEAASRRQAVWMSRIDDLERQIAEGREREAAVAEALVVATQFRADSEREATELKAASVREAATVEEEARQRAEGILREAEAKGEGILEDARSKASGFDQELHEVEELAVGVRARLTAFLESLLAEIGWDGGPGPPVDRPRRRAANELGPG